MKSLFYYRFLSAIIGLNFFIYEINILQIRDAKSHFYNMLCWKNKNSGYTANSRRQTADSLHNNVQNNCL
jgi:hypothetical protein